MATLKKIVGEAYEAWIQRAENQVGQAGVVGFLQTFARCVTQLTESRHIEQGTDRLGHSTLRALVSLNEEPEPLEEEEEEPEPREEVVQRRIRKVSFAAAGDEIAPPPDPPPGMGPPDPRRALPPGSF